MKCFECGEIFSDLEQECPNCGALVSAGRICTICDDVVEDTLEAMRAHLELHHSGARKFDADEVVGYFIEG